MKKTFVFAFRRSLPILISFFPVGIAYGLLMQNAGYNFLWTGACSLFVLAGSLQFLMVSFFAERVLPFAVFGSHPVPPAIRYLGKILPLAVMATLVIYCLRGISFAAAATFVPELISVAVVVALHLWKRSTFLSIVGGTACYMLLVQLVF